ncbi:MAG: 16S rRNA (guanine(966)-N(2))-methyltransferase RsmD [Defluviitaleaceae bacterium]|nr:16S rRNA (guanine(966)-N(2))-methyltransferase RsmD [Defluviitaleaceae bacterium]
MRVISGKARGAVLYAPKFDGVRPTTDFVKENLFNIIQNDVMGARFLDIFAGSGAIGIEALSRGAVLCVFVDSAQKSIELLRKNLEKTRLDTNAAIIKGDVPQVLKKLHGKVFDIIFLDPPYFKNFAAKCVDAILEQNILARDGFIVLEIGSKEEYTANPQLDLLKEKVYGSSKLIFLSKR